MTRKQFILAAAAAALILSGSAPASGNTQQAPAILPVSATEPEYAAPDKPQPVRYLTLGDTQVFTIEAKCSVLDDDFGYVVTNDAGTFVQIVRRRPKGYVPFLNITVKGWERTSRICAVRPV